VGKLSLERDEAGEATHFLLSLAAPAAAS
jgi:hypothetical protein